MDNGSHDSYSVKSRNLKIFLSEEDRPREKAKNKGFGALSTAELMAILIGSGSTGESVVELCQRILRDHDDKLYKIARLSIKDLMRYKGIGEVKAIEVLAALEMSRRYQLEEFEEDFQVKCSEDVYRYMRQVISHLSHEELWILILNRANRVTERIRVSQGGTSKTVGDIKMILRTALEHRAEGIIMCHNHPSDSLNPSVDDDNLTKLVRNGCNAIGISFLDHIVVSRSGYYSYADHGKVI